MAGQPAPPGVVSSDQDTSIMGQNSSTLPQDFSNLALGDASGGFTDPPQPPEPQISSVGVVTTDITEVFQKAAKKLAPGELVKDGFFTLFESVGALEIMDPKMDSGCLPPGESLDEEYDVTRQLEPKEVLGIIDQLLCLEMAWHQGYPLSQTIFTNVYVDAILTHNPTKLDDANFIKYQDDEVASPMHTVLRAYCLCLLKTCSLLIERIRFEHYYEEEDFVSNTYHRSLLESINTEEIFQEIENARAAMDHMSQSLLPRSLSLALEYRLTFRYTFLQAIEWTDFDVLPDDLWLAWKELGRTLVNVTESHPLGVPVPESFSTKLQRHLASTMPPRPIVQPSFEEACTLWRRMFEDGEEMHSIISYTDSQTLLNFVITFQSKKPQPLVFMRTLAQNYIFRENIILRHMSIRQLMDDDFATVVLPSSILLDPTNDAIEAVQHPRFIIANHMEAFRQRAAQAYLDLFRCFSQNRARIRRTLCHALQDWEMVQVDAEEIDQLLQPQLEDPALGQAAAGAAAASVDALPLSSWSYLYKLRVMEWIVQLGFELEVYQPDELAGMYWYLSYLAKRRLQHLERIKSFTARALETARGAAPALAQGDEAAYARSLSYLRAAMLDAAVTWELADALSCLHTVLRRRLRLLPEPDRPYSSDALRYDVRMKPFAAAGLPELPGYAAFARETDQPGVPTRDVLAYAERAVAGAKKGWEMLTRMGPGETFSAGAMRERWLGGAKSCLKAAIWTGVAVSTVQRELEKAGGEDEAVRSRLKAEVEAPSKGYHEWWIVPKVTAVS